MSHAPRSRKSTSKVTLSIEEMSKLLWELPTSTISKRLGCSDASVDKFCKKHGISKPPRGYWAKLRASEKPKDLDNPKLSLKEIMQNLYRDPEYRKKHADAVKAWWAKKKQEQVLVAKQANAAHLKCVPEMVAGSTPVEDTNSQESSRDVMD